MPQTRLRRRLYEPWLSHLPFSYLDLARGDDDVAHALYPTDGAIAARWSRRTGRPAVLSYMGLPHRASLYRPGEKDIAVENLFKAAQLPGFMTYGALKLLPWYDPLRGEPRFEKIVESIAPKEFAGTAK